jgi:hypothetical protein
MERMELTAPSIAALFKGCNAEQRKSFVEQIKSAVDGGSYTAMEMVAMLRNLREIAEQSEEAIHSYLIDEVEKHGKEVTQHGVKFTIAEVGTKYDYENCKDMEWTMYRNAEQRNADARKAREKFLKTLTKPMTLVNEDTGEVDTINPPIKSSTTKVKLTIEK